MFANELSADRKIKCEPLYLEVKEGVELPPKVRRAQATHHHWRPRAEQIVRKMQKEGILVQVDEVTPAIRTSATGPLSPSLSLVAARKRSCASEETEAVEKEAIRREAIEKEVTKNKANKKLSGRKLQERKEETSQVIKQSSKPE